MKLKAVLILLSLAFVALAVRWSEIRVDQPRPSHRIVLLADDSTLNFARRLAGTYQRAVPDTSVNVQAPRPDRILDLLRAGHADAALVEHWLAPDEVALQTHTLALDALCLIVHRSNPVVGLSPDQISQVYAGRVSDWSSLGVDHGQIRPVCPPRNRFITRSFMDAFDLDAGAMPATLVVDSAADVVDCVSSDPSAVGMVSLTVAHERMMSSSPIRLVPIGGVRPMPANIRSGDYPYILPINLVTRADAGDDARSLLTLAQQGAARDIARALRLIEVSPRISASDTTGSPMP